MSVIEENLKNLNIILPPAPSPAANYVPYSKTGKLIFVSGQIPIVNGEMIIGKVGKDTEVNDAVKAARACGLAIISQLREATNSNLDSKSKIIKLGGFVNCVDSFTKQPEIINGASDSVSYTHLTLPTILLV